MQRSDKMRVARYLHQFESSGQNTSVSRSLVANLDLHVGLAV